MFLTCIAILFYLVIILWASFVSFKSTLCFVTAYALCFIEDYFSGVLLQIEYTWTWVLIKVNLK